MRPNEKLRIAPFEAGPQLTAQVMAWTNTILTWAATVTFVDGTNADRTG